MADGRLLRVGEVLARRLNGTAHVLGRSLYDLEIIVEEPIQTEEAVVIAANHFSHLDPVLVTMAARRNVRYLAVDELFGRSRVFDATTAMFGAIPLPRRGVPLGALRVALDHLKTGGALGVFPEGRRVVEWGDEPPRRGAAWLALQVGAPLYPVAIIGSGATMSPADPRFRRAPVCVRTGPAIAPDEYLEHVDPLGSMMADWLDWMNQTLAPWASVGGRRSRGDSHVATQ